MSKDGQAMGLDSLEFFGIQKKREWLSTDEVANYLGISSNAVRIMVHRGQIQTYKFGRRLRFRFKDCLVLITKKGV
ncbi:MAG: helix-turn-helix domain-containing protein [Bacteriovoracaceae bacterium]|jgi:excisionase family DNA binding protein